MVKLILGGLVVAVLVAGGWWGWVNYRYLWDQRGASFYQDETADFTFYYPREFVLFKPDEIKRRNEKFVAGFKNPTRDSIACGVIELERPAGFVWDPSDQLEKSSDQLRQNQEGFEEVAAKVTDTPNGRAILIDHRYQHDAQTRARNRQLSFATDEKFVYLTCGGPDAVFADHLRGFELFFKTFRLL